MQITVPVRFVTWALSLVSYAVLHNSYVTFPIFLPPLVSPMWEDFQHLKSCFIFLLQHCFKDIFKDILCNICNKLDSVQIANIDLYIRLFYCFGVFKKLFCLSSLYCNFLGQDNFPLSPLIQYFLTNSYDS